MEGLLERKYYKGFGSALTVWRHEWFVFNGHTRVLTILKGQADRPPKSQCQNEGPTNESEQKKEQLEVLDVRDVPNRSGKREHRFDFILRSTWKVCTIIAGVIAASANMFSSSSLCVCARHQSQPSSSGLPKLASHSESLVQPYSITCIHQACMMGWSLEQEYTN